MLYAYMHAMQVLNTWLFFVEYSLQAPTNDKNYFSIFCTYEVLT